MRRRSFRGRPRRRMSYRGGRRKRLRTYRVSRGGIRM